MVIIGPKRQQPQALEAYMASNAPLSSSVFDRKPYLEHASAIVRSAEDENGESCPANTQLFHFDY
jgi:hypothetical protein